MKHYLWTVGLLTLSLNANALDQIDPEYRDDKLRLLYYTLKLTGALQPDLAAMKAGANEWRIAVEKIELKGTTADELNHSFSELKKREQRTLFQQIKEMYPDFIPASQKTFNQEFVTKINQEHSGDVRVLLQEGFDLEKTREWIVEELLTRAGRHRAEHYFDPQQNSRKKFEYLRLHYSDHQAEVIGYDVLLIRGVRDVVIIRIDYSHS